MKLKKFLFALPFVGATSALAEGEVSTVTVPTAVTSAISNLESGAEAYADVILPYIVDVGIAFVGISVVYLLFKVFRRFVGGGR